MIYPALSRAAPVGFLVAITFSAPTAAAERCNPPYRQCAFGSYTYPCPPCPPGGVNAALPELESYRNSLETYRKGIEAKRSDDPGGSLVGYDKALDNYHRGMSDYKDAIGEILGEPK
jgi:hypothetical protein